MEIKLPANWDEIIKAGKYLPVIKALQQPYNSNEACMYALFKCLTGYTGADAFADVPLDNTSMAELTFSAALVDEVFPHLAFITERTPFYINPIPHFTHKLTTYKAPDERLINQTGEEWSISHHAEYMFKQTGNRLHLVTLVAANYHAASQKVGRIAFNEKEFEKACAELADLPDEILHGIYLWYQHADDWWTLQFPQLFAGDEDSKPVKATGMEVRNIIFELAGNSLGDAWDKLQARNRQDIIYALDRLEARRE